MKTSLIVILFSLLSIHTYSQHGSFKIINAEGERADELAEGVALFAEEWVSFSFYTSDKFIGVMGGTVDRSNDLITTLNYEFNAIIPGNATGNEEVEVKKIDDKTIKYTFGDYLKLTLEKMDTRPDPMNGVWRISERERNGEMRQMTWGARKTLKFLIGNRFQWVAFNAETGEFSGTGGGYFEATNGEYIEKIDFFSRDQTRVGAELSFNFELNDDEWVHSGLSSKGSPIKEIWKRVDKE